jgi:hypothetical protein
MPRFSCSGVALSDVGFINCNVLVFLKAIFTFVFLNSYQLCIRVVPPEDGKVMPETC